MLQFIIEAAKNNLLYIILFVFFVFCLHKISDILEIDLKAIQRYIIEQLLLNPLHYLKRIVGKISTFLHDVIFFKKSNSKKNHKHKINLLKNDYINHILSNNTISYIEAAEILQVNPDSDKETVMQAFRTKLEETSNDDKLNHQQKIKQVQALLQAKYRILGS